MPAAQPKGLTLALTDNELDAIIAALALLRREVNRETGYEEGGEDLEEDILAALAGTLLTRIATMLPEEPAGPKPRALKGDGPHHGTIRRAIQTETKLVLSYVDRKDHASRRAIWPLELGHAGAGETVAAWCETRRDFRHFRLDRITALEDTGERYAGRRRILLARLRLAEMESFW